MTPVDSSATIAVARWNDADGSAIYLPGEPGLAQVILPPVLDDSVPAPARAQLPPSAAPASIDLFAPVGKLATIAVGPYAVATQPTVGDGCDAWPLVPLRDTATVPHDRWRLALQAGLAEAMRADSIGGMAASDSAALVVDLNKAVARLPIDSSGVLRRVPFGVSKAYRFRLADGTEVVLAVVERRLNVEASPRVERTTVLLERPSGTKLLAPAWHERQFTSEDDLIAVDLLAAVTFRGESRPTVFLRHDFGDGSRVHMLQRTPDGRWSLRWASAYTGC
ncbi:MAG TPA: hypothetical protein VE861_10820 [Gemmatimonadaceae bacterium]|nr:hypothetical protein [Gemmatimonadaceae bacterium]